MTKTLAQESSMVLGTTAGTAPMASQAPATQPTNWCMVPRCDVRFEKCSDGMKIHCSCSDEMACSVMQNLCRMLAGGMCSVCCQLNGVTVCDIKLTCGMCKCEFTEDGCCITCTSGDEACCKLIQACCDTLAACADCGCACFVCFNGTPVCCCC